MSTELLTAAEIDVRGADQSVTRWKWDHWRWLGSDLSTKLSLIIVTVLANAWNITGYPAVGDDEGTYLAQAWAIQHGEGLAHYTYWYDHPPFGWIQIAAISWIPSNILPGHLAVAHGRAIMPVVTTVSVLLLHTFGRRIGLNTWWSALAGLLFALSPLSLVLQRQIYLDNFAVMWMLAAFVLALSPRRHLWHHIASGICAALAVLSKETIIVVLPALVLTLWQASNPATRKFSLAGFSSSFALVGIIYPLFALLKGELLPGAGHVSLFDGIFFQLHREGSGSFLVSGTASRAVVGSWLYYDSFLIVAGFLAAIIGLALRQLRAPALVVTLLAVVAARPGYLPAMFVIQALPFLALCIVGTLAAACCAVLRWRSSSASWLVRWTAVALLASTAAGLVGYIGPRWYTGDRVAFTASVNEPYLAAVSWIHHDLPHTPESRILVDDAMWLDLVNDGSTPGTGAIWFYKLDLDPGVRLPHGWRDVDYVISTPIMRQALSGGGLPGVSAALEHSVVLAIFGTGADRIEVRAVRPRP